MQQKAACTHSAKALLPCHLVLQRGQVVVQLAAKRLQRHLPCHTDSVAHGAFEGLGGSYVPAPAKQRLRRRCAVQSQATAELT